MGRWRPQAAKAFPRGRSLSPVSAVRISHMTTEPTVAFAGIHDLWDEMAGFDASRTDEAIDCLMTRLCERVGAHNASCIVAVRLPDIAPRDPLRGWRAPLIRFLHPVPPLLAAAQEQARRIDAGEFDVTTARNVAQAGAWRVNRLVDLVEPEWFESAYYRVHYQGCGHEDAIWAGCPVNDDAEVYFGFYRGADRARFADADRDVVLAVLRGLKWLFRQYLLGYGLSVATSPLTPVERAVLQGLLGGGTESQIAGQIGHSSHTTHEYIKRIYRKFGVNNRPALTALWLGQRR